MGRSVKKGPFIDAHLLEKVLAMENSAGFVPSFNSAPPGVLSVERGRVRAWSVGA